MVQLADAVFIGGNEELKVLVVAGGGGGGGYCGGGGGGGSVEYDAAFTVTEQAYPVVVGAGGEAAHSGVAYGTNGGTSTFDTITAYGGGHGSVGGGGDWDGASSGGSGGGGGSANGFTVGGAAGSGSNVFAGGDSPGTGGYYVSAGGGGGSEVGESNANTNTVAAGGDGATSTIYDGSVDYYAGGGGGGSSNAPDPQGSGGAGGGGDGGAQQGTDPTDGDANTGGGGGGGENDIGDGGSGIVIFRYVTADFGTCTGGATTTDGDDTIHTFTSDGTFTVVAPEVYDDPLSFSQSTTTYRSATSSLKIEGLGSTTTIKVVAASGTKVVLTAYLRTEGYPTNATRTQAGIGLEGLGMSASSSMTTTSNDVWEQVTVSATPTSDGVATIKIWGEATSSSGYLYIDDMTATQSGISIDTGQFHYWVSASMPAEYVYDTGNIGTIDTGEFAYWESATMPARYVYAMSGVSAVAPIRKRGQIINYLWKR